MTNSKFQIPNFIILLLTIVIGFLFTITGVHAVELYLESSQFEYSSNEIFSVDIRLNLIPLENINALEVYLSFDRDVLEAVDFSTANSILTFIKNPVIDEQNGVINFSGIIPGGYTGRLAGDPGKSNLLGTAILQVKKQENGTALISFLTNYQTFLNDGQGTKAILTFLPLEIKIKKKEMDSDFLNDWEKTKEDDKTPPEEFIPEIVEMENRYFLMFNTQDKQSGINNYAVYESIRKKTKINLGDWQLAESLYLLKDQNLESYIYVKAVDKASNERIAIVNPQTQTQIKWYVLYKNYLIWVIMLLIILSYLSFRLWFYQKIK